MSDDRYILIGALLDSQSNAYSLSCCSTNCNMSRFTLSRCQTLDYSFAASPCSISLQHLRKDKDYNEIGAVRELSRQGNDFEKRWLQTKNTRVLRKQEHWIQNQAADMICCTE